MIHIIYCILRIRVRIYVLSFSYNKKLFSTFGIYPKCGIEAVINNIENVLQRLFVIKAANEALEWKWDGSIIRNVVKLIMN